MRNKSLKSTPNNKLHHYTKTPLIAVYENTNITILDSLDIITKLLTHNQSNILTMKSLAVGEFQLFFPDDMLFHDFAITLFLCENFIKSQNQTPHIIIEKIETGFKVTFPNIILPLVDTYFDIFNQHCTPDNPYYFSQPKYATSLHLINSYAFQLGLENSPLILHNNVKDFYLNQILAYQLGKFTAKDTDLQRIMIQLNKHRYKESQEEPFFNRFNEWEEEILDAFIEKSIFCRI